MSGAFCPPAASVDAIDAMLPQTQCGKCGFGGCRPYAEAIASGAADINRCPPGGRAGIDRLAAMLGREAPPLDPTCGVEGPESAVVIDERACIGCTLCIQACPVDAIVGAAKRMHTVLLDECTGCELCLPACPVDCIELMTVEELQASGHCIASRPDDQWRMRAAHARGRFERRAVRIEKEKVQREARLAAKAAEKLRTLPADTPDAERKRAVIEAALERARARRRSGVGT